jgi:transcriptional regulator with XRE-family HTH domain
VSELERWRGATAAESRPPGEMLREWRRRRGLSQLALALDADVSSRHLSFLETGRAAPSREMLLRLAARLQIPLRERNELLVAAGYAAEFRQRAVDDAALRTVRHAVNLMLTSLEPCPAIAVDRHWTMLAGNRPAAAWLSLVAPELRTPPVNALRVSLHPGGLAPRIVNLPEWRAHVFERLARDVARTADAALAALLAELRALPEPPGSRRDAPRHDPGAELPVAVPLRMRGDDGILSFLTTTTVFGTALDVDVAELAIESFLPADDATAAALRRQAAAMEAAGSVPRPTFSDVA